MSKNFELLAPGGDIDSIKAAVIAGADAVYCGLDYFNARNSATNIVLDDLYGIIRFAHLHNCKIFLTLNILMLDYEISVLVELLNKLVNTKVDGVIVQDLGLFYILKKHFTTLKVHASTQVTTHNSGQLDFLSKLGAERVNLSRELNIGEIKDLTAAAHDRSMKTEVFIHGSYCVGFSGLCYFSSVHGGSSGNRGRCRQPCRDEYQKSSAGFHYPLNLKDNSAFHDLDELEAAKVDSLKVEGRIKKPHYVYTVVNGYKNGKYDDLYKVFNRDFTNGFLKSNLTKEMFIDNPRNNSIKHLVEKANCSCDEEIQWTKSELHDKNLDNIAATSKLTEACDLSKDPVTISLSGKVGEPLEASVSSKEINFSVQSEAKLAKSEKNSINIKDITKRFSHINKTEFKIDSIDLTSLGKDLFISYREQSTIRDKVIFRLNGSVEQVPPIELPKLEGAKKRSHDDKATSQPTLTVLISDIEDLELCDSKSHEICFQIPSDLESCYSKLVKLFSSNKEITPWFPSLLIGKNFTLAVKLLNELNPKQIVTNNSGVAHTAYKEGIKWIAGPYMNITNSFSLKCLKEEFNCSGAFISKEISKIQIRKIVKPQDFTLYYSIYHPILLLTSRQCLFFTTSGCEKDKVDKLCLKECKKRTSIVNMKDETFVINKEPCEYNSVYSQNNFLNTDMINDQPDLCSNILVDLRDIKTGTEIKVDKKEIVKQFKELLYSSPNAADKLKESITGVSNSQYQKGL